jgi:hypothetical protein
MKNPEQRLSELITGLMPVACATRAEGNVCCAVTDLNASKLRTIVLPSISLVIHGPDEICAESPKILSVQECGVRARKCGDELTSGITGSWSVFDRGHGITSL